MNNPDPSWLTPGPYLDPAEREKLVQVLIYHQRRDIGSCQCGWSVLGASHAEHVVDVYEQVLSEDRA